MVAGASLTRIVSGGAEKVQDGARKLVMEKMQGANGARSRAGTEGTGGRSGGWERGPRTRVVFPLCATGLALPGIRYGSLPRRVMLSATVILGLWMDPYGAVGIGRLGPWGRGGRRGQFLKTASRHGRRRRTTATWDSRTLMTYGTCSRSER
jgi:hypothetical protein